MKTCKTDYPVDVLHLINELQATDAASYNVRLPSHNPWKVSAITAPKFSNDEIP